MKKRILLPAILCMAISIFTASCSSDDIESPEAKEQMVTLTVSAGTEDAAAATRAVLSEADAAKSPWKWEQGDKILLVSGNRVSTLSLKKMKTGNLSAEFEGQVPAGSLTNGGTYRFFYVGKNSDGNGDRTIDASKGSINIDLTQQTGELKDLKRNCVLTGTGKVSVSGKNATTEGDIVLSNVFAVAHFNIKANDNTTITKVGLRGKGVYRSAKVNLTDGSVTGVSEIGTVADPEENIFFNGKTDFYVTFVPGSVAPAFDGYYADSYRSVITTTPETRNYDEDKSLVYFDGAKAKFSVSDTKQVAITNGNMQYAMPIATYTFTMNAKTLSANTLIRWKNSVPLKLKATRTVHAGYYRLAPEQWKTAMPKATKAGATYRYAFITMGGNKYVSPEAYRYFDLPSWGTINNPTLLNYSFTASNDIVADQNDYGHKLMVGGRRTRVLNSDEWEYLMPNKQLIDNNLPNNNRVWVEGRNKYAKWARCFIDENGNGKRENSELRGYLIFPDKMTRAQAEDVFTKAPRFGRHSNANNNPTTYDRIKKSGAVFFPLTAYRPAGSHELQQWGNHGNYTTSSRNGNSMYHVKFTESSTNYKEGSAPNQGCASRLVQDY